MKTSGYPALENWILRYIFICRPRGVINCYKLKASQCLMNCKINLVYNVILTYVEKYVILRWQFCRCLVCDLVYRYNLFTFTSLRWVFFSICAGIRRRTEWSRDVCISYWSAGVSRRVSPHCVDMFCGCSSVFCILVVSTRRKWN